MGKLLLFLIVAAAIVWVLPNACSHKSVPDHATASLLKSGTAVAQKGAEVTIVAGAKGLVLLHEEWFKHEPARAGAWAGFSTGCIQTRNLLGTLPAIAKDLAKIAWNTDYEKWFHSLAPNVQKCLLAAPSIAKQKLDALPDDVREALAAFDGEVTLSFGNRPASERTEFKAGYVSGWIGWQVATAAVCDRVLKLAAEGKAALSGDETARLAASRARYRMLCNRETRIPENEGVWIGAKGESAWKSDLPEVNAITHNGTVGFKNGSPDFTPWSQGSLKFEKGELAGTEEDFPRIYKKLAEEKNLPSEAAARDYLQSKGLTPHHWSETEIQLVPTAIHANIPHTGGAAFLRTETM